MGVMVRKFDEMTSEMKAQKKEEQKKINNMKSINKLSKELKRQQTARM